MSKKRTVQPITSSSLNSDARATLSNLGHTPGQASEASKQVRKGGDKPFKEMFKNARKERS